MTLPPPVSGSTISAPFFTISPSVYTAVLDVRVPITIAVIYASVVTLLNAYNKSRGNRPWRISTTTAFLSFVVAHNVFLAAYSAWTFIGMLKALSRSAEHPGGPGGFAGSIDSLCKIQGPRGLGNAVRYNPASSSWISPSSSVPLANGGPDSTDLGRLWNEGLAFYGWFFYLSKFYEVLDTFIILAKGKRSSTLQTYHHAGAMLCMWAGIRYMSPPIWLFVFLNSAIHFVMVSKLLQPFHQQANSSTVLVLHCHRVRDPGAHVIEEVPHNYADHPIPRRSCLRHSSLLHLLRRARAGGRPHNRHSRCRHCCC